MQNTKDNSLTLLELNSDTPVAKAQVECNDDLQFLINCCKTNPSEDDLKAIISYLNAERLDLNALIGLAHQHGILPLVYKTI